MLEDDKYTKLIGSIREKKKMAVAFSGGVDSALLLFAAKEALGKEVLALIADSESFPEKERDQAREFCEKRDIPFVIVKVKQMDIPGFEENGPDRCYLCKRALFSSLMEEAHKQGFSYLA